MLAFHQYQLHQHFVSRPSTTSSTVLSLSISNRLLLKSVQNPNSTHIMAPSTSSPAATANQQTTSIELKQPSAPQSMSTSFLLLTPLKPTHKNRPPKHKHAIARARARAKCGSHERRRGLSRAILLCYSVSISV